MTLRELLEQPVPEREPWADAQDYARSLFGTAVAAAITWSVDATGEVTGALTDGTSTLLLRYECEEPSSVRMLVRVTCPYDAVCDGGMDTVICVAQLLSVLDGGLAEGDPQCDVGWEDEHEPRREVGIVDGTAAGWQPARQWPY